MSDRLREIRARLDSFHYAVGQTHTMPGNYIGPCEDEFYEQAPADIAWLLDEVQRLNKLVRMYEVVKS